MFDRFRNNDEDGFTLIELLVVVIIIGILAAIAIPTFLNQRENAWRSSVQSDLRNAAVVMEQEFSANGTYAGVGEGDFNLSPGVAGNVTVNANATTYCLQMTHDSLAAQANPTYSLDSRIGSPENNACAAL